MTTRSCDLYAKGYSRAYGLHHNPDWKNPYPPNSQDAKDWQKGFDAGFNEVKDIDIVKILFNEGSNNSER